MPVVTFLWQSTQACPSFEILGAAVVGATVAGFAVTSLLLGADELRDAIDGVEVLLHALHRFELGDQCDGLVGDPYEQIALLLEDVAEVVQLDLDAELVADRPNGRPL